MIEFRMPSLGADMDSGTLIEWLKAPGDSLKHGDIIAVVETQKGAIEIEVFDDGVLAETFVRPGEEVPIGTVLANIRGVEEPVVQRSEPSPVPEEKVQPQPAEKKRPIAPEAPRERRGTALRVTPAARNAARQRGVDLASITSGPDNIIGLREIEGVLTKPAKIRRGAIDQDEMRKAIAAAMTRSNREIPHYYVTSTIDMTPMMDWLARYNSEQSVEHRLHYAVPLLKAVAFCLRKFTDLNGTYVDNVYKPAEAINMGIAIATRGKGLITPAILEIDTLDLPTLMERLNDLVKRVRSGGLRSSELSMGTVTLTNLGERTADLLMPIIYPPQVAIIGCGQLGLRPWVVDAAIVSRQLMDVTLAADHRVSDGRRGAQFLGELSSILATPEAL